MLFEKSYYKMKQAMQKMLCLACFLINPVFILVWYAQGPIYC